MGALLLRAKAFYLTACMVWCGWRLRRRTGIDVNGWRRRAEAGLEAFAASHAAEPKPGQKRK